MNGARYRKFNPHLLNTLRTPCPRCGVRLICHNHLYYFYLILIQSFHFIAFFEIVYVALALPMVLWVSAAPAEVTCKYNELQEKANAKRFLP